ncbi:MAG TPA: zinc metallopeptidase [Candidatus Eisenbacteria bacterium]|jgi:Zn-dependent membrane protease YugP|nr:zinc metallopeptidase [Candidatus Eisenbacteria bacterium]
MFLYDWTFLLLIPGLILGIWAQRRVISTYRKYANVPSSSGLTGREMAARILQHGGVTDVAIEPTPGQLSDHYDPVKRTLKLSQPVYDSNSIAALGVAAHEAGHAIQHAQHYFPMSVRWALLTPANLGTTIAPWLVIAGFFLGQAGPIVMDIGIVLFSAAVLFHLVTLPVEFNASRRAVQELQTAGIVAPNEVGAVREVLQAAGFTYVAAAASSILGLIRLLVLRRQR